MNGINNKNKQLQLVDFITFRRLDILMIQEHNIKDIKNICKELLKICDVYLNPTINQKGGTAIFINKKLNYKCIHNNMSADSRIIALKI